MGLILKHLLFSSVSWSGVSIRTPSDPDHDRFRTESPTRSSALVPVKHPPPPLILVCGLLPSSEFWFWTLCSRDAELQSGRRFSLRSDVSFVLDGGESDILFLISDPGFGLPRRPRGGWLKFLDPFGFWSFLSVRFLR